MTTPPFISACLSMMESEVGEPRRVGGPTRHGGGPIRRGARFWLTFGQFWRLWAGATSCWKPNATWRGPNTTWRALSAHFWAVLPPWRRSHVVLEVQRDMAGSQYDVAHSFDSLFGGFGAFGLEPRRVGGPTRHGGGQCDVARSFGSLLGSFAALEAEPRRVGGPTRHGALPTRRGGRNTTLHRLFLGTSTHKKPPPS